MQHGNRFAAASTVRKYSPFLDVKVLHTQKEQLAQIKAAKDARLKEGLTIHREETLHQIERLEKVFEILSMRPKAHRLPS